MITKPDLPKNGEVFTVASVRTSSTLIRYLYLYSDKHGGRVEELTDEIISNYEKIHKNDKLLTSYLGFDSSYRYNLQIKFKTMDKINKMAEKYNVSKSDIYKTALMIWAMEHY